MKLTFPTDPILADLFGVEAGPSLKPHQRPKPKNRPKTKAQEAKAARSRARRCYLDRLARAEAKGVLPPRIYITARLFGYDAELLDKKLAALPKANLRAKRS